MEDKSITEILENFMNIRTTEIFSEASLILNPIIYLTVIDTSIDFYNNIICENSEYIEIKNLEESSEPINFLLICEKGKKIIDNMVAIKSNMLLKKKSKTSRKCSAINK